jgi:hypothetical protein
VLPLVLAASISAVLSMRHNDGVEPQHTESGVKPPSNLTATANSTGAGRARSMTVTITPHEVSLPDQPHEEPIGGGIPATGFDITQRS